MALSFTNHDKCGSFDGGVNSAGTLASDITTTRPLTSKSRDKNRMFNNNNQNVKTNNFHGNTNFTKLFMWDWFPGKYLVIHYKLEKFEISHIV